MTGSTVRYRGDAGDRRLRRVAVTEKTRDAVVAGMLLMAEGNRLAWRAVLKIEWQIVHKDQDGDNDANRNDKTADKPRYFHAVYQEVPLAFGHEIPSCCPARLAVREQDTF